MAIIHIKYGNVISGGDLLKNSSVYINGSKIVAIGKTKANIKGSLIIDAKGCFVAPGFIDCHIHGDPETIFSNEIRAGTTAVIISISCAPLDEIHRKIERVNKFKRLNPLGTNLLGIHLEGPYINRDRAGAQEKAHIRSPSLKELRGLIKISKSILKIMTIAPELKGVKPLTRLLVKNRVIPSMGHTEASYEEAVEGIDSGIRYATHIFNCMRPIDRRSPGAVLAALLDKRVRVEVILDGVHLHRAIFSLLLKTKGVDNVILVTDSVASGSPRGAHLSRDGVYRLKDDRIAGSSLTMMGALKNAVRYGGLSVPDAVRLITLNPARLLGIQNRKGAIAAGKDADIVIFDKDFDVKMTIINGEIAYRETRQCAG